MQKYRAYHTVLGWADPKNISLFGDGTGRVDYPGTSCSLTNPCLHLKRVANKTDRRGVVVWEGAVLKFRGSADIFYIIEWADNKWRIRWDWKTAETRKQKTLGLIPGNISNIMEIMGDCHEKPELMKLIEETPDE